MEHNKNLAIGFKEYFELIDLLKMRINSAWGVPDHIIGILRGGVIAALRLSYLFGDIPLAVIAAEHWPNGKKLPDVRFARHVVYKTDTINGKVLVIDDLTEEGLTLLGSIPYLKEKFPDITEIKTAVVYHKSSSKFIPDFYGQLLEPDAETNKIPWITNPLENPEILLDGIKEI